MTEWKRQGETVCMPNTVCCAMAADGEEARMIVAAHNAICDAYEARIAEVEAQSIAFHAEAAGHYQALARVKAESLRVVVDGDLREAYRCDKVLYNARYCTASHRIQDDYFPIQINEVATGKYVDKVTHQTLLQPVRLERWEAQND